MLLKETLSVWRSSRCPTSVSETSPNFPVVPTTWSKAAYASSLRVRDSKRSSRLPWQTRASLGIPDPQGACVGRLEGQGFQAKLSSAVALTADQEKAYGSW